MRRPTTHHLRAAVGVLLGALLAVGLAACGGGGGDSKGKTGTSAPTQSKSSAPAGTRPVSGPLIGVMFDGPALAPSVDLGQQLDRAVANGAESIRLVVDWSRMQPTAEGPIRFADLDSVAAAAAARGLTLLPVVERTPSWDALTPGDSGSPPRDAAPFGVLLTALVKRYGPAGDFWTAHPNVPRVPIRMWQIWNEPHFTSYWSQQPFAPGYVKLLATAHGAIKAADPGAKVVLAGLADFSWQYLAQIYRVPGARGLFDIVALHPYTGQPQGVITIMQRARAVMNAHGDAAKPILTTEPGQAARLAALTLLLEANRARLGLMGFYWYTWMGNETPRPHPYGFDFAGLEKWVSGQVTAKPALAVFRRSALRLERCTGKASATRCAG
jgi:polysaccharide biosynthesis protein PslG